MNKAGYKPWRFTDPGRAGAAMVFIFDEPTSALDPSVQAKVLKLLLQLQERRGLAMLFITHDIALARKVSDRIAVIRAGRIVEEGPAGQITTGPRHEYTRMLLQAAPGLEFREPKLDDAISC